MSREPAIHGLVLAAGGSTRMGRPKALLQTRGLLPGATLIEAHIRALGPHCQSMTVVLGAHADAVYAVLPAQVNSVLNKDWEQTHLADSIGLGLLGLPDEGLALITPVDIPPAPAAVIHALIAVGAPAVPTHQGQPGHPVLVLAGPTRRALQTQTLAQVLASAARLEVDWPDTLTNLNTPADWQSWMERLSADR